MSVNELHKFTDLPQPLLELILIPLTSTKDKKALRQTCKQFRQVLDNSLTCIRLPHFQDPKILEQFMKRMQQALGLKTLILASPSNTDSVFKLLPEQLTTLTVVSVTNLDVKELKRLPCLSALNIGRNSGGTVTGLECISELTSLHCHSPVGSLAHLAPTLIHLSIKEFSHVSDMDQLTNLKELEIHSNVPADFFSKHWQLPLQHMCIEPDYCWEFLYKPVAWRSAPTTLTQLTLTGKCDFASLPFTTFATITHLQLLYMHGGTVERLATAFPGLQRLDLYLHAWAEDWNSAFVQLNELTSLKVLSLCMYAGDGTCLQRDQILSALPEVAKAVERVLQLVVIPSYQEMLGVFREPRLMKSAWVTRL